MTPRAAPTTINLLYVRFPTFIVTIVIIMCPVSPSLISDSPHCYIHHLFKFTTKILPRYNHPIFFFITNISSVLVALTCSWVTLMSYSASPFLLLPNNTQTIIIISTTLFSSSPAIVHRKCVQL